MRIADDFGFAGVHDQAMLSLLTAGAIDGVSVMVSDDMDVVSLERLKALWLTQGIAVGLHLNLTQCMPGNSALGGILPLWLRSTFGRLPRQRAAQSFERQLDLFVGYFGRPPDFLDGHHHCHAIPALWPALQHLQARLPERRWIRSPSPATFSGMRRELRQGGIKTLLVMTWGWLLRRRLERAGIPTNRDFSGFMRYRAGNADYAQRFRRMLESADADCLVMVHPGSDRTGEANHPPVCRAIETRVLAERRRWASASTQGVFGVISR